MQDEKVALPLLNTVTYSLVINYLYNNYLRRETNKL